MKYVLIILVITLFLLMLIFRYYQLTLIHFKF